MSIMELGALGEFVGAFAVVMSLLYVGFQVRQNTRSVNAEMVQSQVDKTNRVSALLIEQPLLADALIRARDGVDLTSSDEMRIRIFYSMALRNFEAFLSAERLGVLSEQDVAIHVGGIGRSFATRHGRIWWDNNREDYPKHLVARVDALVADAEQSLLGATQSEV